MGIRLRTVVWTFIWCLFMQVTVGTIFVVAIPATNYVAQPFVCPGGNFQQVAQDNAASGSFASGQEAPYTVLNWYCVDKNAGAKTHVSDLTVIEYSDAIFGVLFFLVLFLAMVLLFRDQRFMAWWKSHSGRRNTSMY
jgi:hypothetical protein